MNKYEFETKDLDYGEIETKIVNYYDLGYTNSSNFMELETGMHSGLSMSCTKGTIEFTSIVGKTKNDTYLVTIIPKSIKRHK